MLSRYRQQCPTQADQECFAGSVNHRFLLEDYDSDFVAPGPSQPYVGDSAVPEPSQPTLGQFVAPEPSQPYVDQFVAPGTSQPITGVSGTLFPTPLQSSSPDDNLVAPEPSQPYVDQFVAP